MARSATRRQASVRLRPAQGSDRLYQQAGVRASRRPRDAFMGQVLFASGLGVLILASFFGWNWFPVNHDGSARHLCSACSSSWFLGYSTFVNKRNWEIGCLTLTGEGPSGSNTMLFPKGGSRSRSTTTIVIEHRAMLLGSPRRQLLASAHRRYPEGTRVAVGPRRASSRTFDERLIPS